MKANFVSAALNPSLIQFIRIFQLFIVFLYVVIALSIRVEASISTPDKRAIQIHLQSLPFTSNAPVKQTNNELPLPIIDADKAGKAEKLANLDTLNTRTAPMILTFVQYTY